MTVSYTHLTDELISQYMDEATLKYTHFLYLMQNCTSGSSILAEEMCIRDRW